MRILLVVSLLCLLGVSASAADRWFETSDGVRLHYIEAGAGHAHTIVFVPGWTMPAWIWDRQIAAFSGRYHVVAMDPRGQGDSEIAPSGYDPQRRGRDVGELIAHLRTAPVLLVGWSLGVLDSLAYVHEDGDAALQGLVMVDNSIGEDPPPVWHPGPRRRLPHAVMMRNFVRGMFTRPQPAGYLRRLTAAALRTPEWAAKRLLAYPVPRTWWKQAVYAVHKPEFYLVRPGLAGQAAHFAARRPEDEVRVLHGPGHALFVDDAGEFNKLLADFMTRRVWR